MKSMPLDKVQAYMDSCDKECYKTMNMHHKEMMSDMNYSHMQHEASESPKYEKMEEAGVKLLKAMRGPKGGY